MTPVYAAAIQGQDEVTEILLEHGSYADTVSKKTVRYELVSLSDAMIFMIMINAKKIMYFQT